MARQLPPAAWVGIEQQIAAVADTSTPRELAKYGEELVHAAHARDGIHDSLMKTRHPSAPKHHVAPQPSERGR